MNSIESLKNRITYLENEVRWLKQELQLVRAQAIKSQNRIEGYIVPNNPYDCSQHKK